MIFKKKYNWLVETVFVFIFLITILWRLGPKTVKRWLYRVHEIMRVRRKIVYQVYLIPLFAVILSLRWWLSASPGILQIMHTPWISSRSKLSWYRPEKNCEFNFADFHFWSLSHHTSWLNLLSITFNLVTIVATYLNHGHFLFLHILHTIDSTKY